MSSGALKKEALQNVEDMLTQWGYPAKGRKPLKQCESDLRNRLIKSETALLRKDQHILALEQKCSALENKLERWKEFFESAMARNRENAELKREIERLKLELSKTFLV